MSKINKSQYAILGWLSKSSMSGYDLKQKFNKVSPYHWSESNAQIYPILKKLEQEGLVSSKLDIASGGRNRRIYVITSEGLAKLEIWLAQPIEPAQYREEILLKLTMAEHAGLELTLQHIQEYYSQVKQQLKGLDSIAEYIKTEHAGKEDQKYLEATYQFTKLNLEAKKLWCEKTLSLLQQ
ncbi:MAG: PadR family transcriptional regulator [Gammaproteobacteria bacterium]|jgi:DNA-binding PadR family transcriptional regulator|nr:PadR family transcriptional regulator [Gammaproteobacteria bacterium]